MLFIDPGSCVDCGLCIAACPVGAIAYEGDLRMDQQPFRDLNAAWFADRDSVPYPILPLPLPQVPRSSSPVVAKPVRIAVVGSGPAGAFATEELLVQRHVEVDMFERDPAPGGLLRYGVAPDHPDTQAAAQVLNRVLEHPRFRLFLGTEIGRDIDHNTLAERYHAVVYAVGAEGDRLLDVPGEGLCGSWASGDVVRWYTGHPRQADLQLELDTETAVVVGNGNVAVDVARLLITPYDALRLTDMADHALEVRRESRVRHVVVVGRGGPENAACSTAELIALQAAGLHVRIDDRSVSGRDSGPATSGGNAAIAQAKRRLIESLPTAMLDLPTVTFAFGLRPVAILGETAVEAVRFAIADGAEVDIECGLVISATGYRATPIPGLPFDAAIGRVPSLDGRVIDVSGVRVPGTYVTGWSRRGARGGVGANKDCAVETIARVMADFEAGWLRRAVHDDVADLLPEAPGSAAWRVLDDLERRAGAQLGRPRVKQVDGAAMRTILRGLRVDSCSAAPAVG